MLFHRKRKEFFSSELLRFDEHVQAYAQDQEYLLDYIKTIITVSNETDFTISEATYVHVARLCEVLKSIEGLSSNSALDYAKLMEEVERLSFDVAMHMTTSEAQRAVLNAEKYMQVIEKMVTMKALQSEVAYYYNGEE